MAGKHVETSGPLFDGRAAKAVKDFCQNFPQDYAGDAVDELQDEFSANFQNPSGRYESSVRARRTKGGYTVSDGGSAYGRWLEGVSPRNRISSFKGYHSFHKVAAKMEREAEAKANAEFKAKYLRRLTGGL